MLEAVLFDLDGTLADTAPDLGDAANVLLREEGRAAKPLEFLRPYTSQGVRGLLKAAFDRPRPDLICAGMSDRGFQFSVREADVCFIGGRTPDERRDASLRAKRAAGAMGTWVESKTCRLGYCAASAAQALKSAASLDSIKRLIAAQSACGMA